MKTYTDLEQSRKLAEILPIESADQTWARVAIAGANLDIPEELQYRHNGDMPFESYSGIGIPCWSLAALIGVLPRYLNYTGGECPLNLLPFDFENPHRKDHCWIVGYWDYDEEYEKYNFQMEAREEEVIDACYKLILKLHEHKLLKKH